MWFCPKCGADVEAGFEVCWQCGTSWAGVEDPSFETADAAGPIADPRAWLSQGEAKLADDDFAGVQPVELVECYWARDGLEARLLADRLIESGIPAVADLEPLSMGLSAAAMGVPYFSPRVRVRAEDLARARTWLADFERNKQSRRPGD
jgi:hypothetical protein